MLDFVKAMEIAHRMCMDSKCNNCPIYNGVACTLKLNPCRDIDWPEVERRLIEWDKAHPEPQYPTLAEWQKENFPHASHGNLAPCLFDKCPQIRKAVPDCKSCVCTPIPADIAKKLGIKPIQRGNENELQN